MKVTARFTHHEDREVVHWLFNQALVSGGFLVVGRMVWFGLGLGDMCAVWLSVFTSVCMSVDAHVGVCMCVQVWIQACSGTDDITC